MPNPLTAIEFVFYYAWPDPVNGGHWQPNDGWLKTVTLGKHPNYWKERIGVFSNAN